MPLNFRELDETCDDMRARHPGWRIWYVPHLKGTTWCAQPLPTLNEESTEDLEKAIKETEADWQSEGIRQ